MSRKIFCDMCGAEIESGKDVITLGDCDWFETDKTFYYDYLNGKDICSKCDDKRLAAHQELEARLLHLTIIKVAERKKDDD